MRAAVALAAIHAFVTEFAIIQAKTIDDVCASRENVIVGTVLDGKTGETQIGVFGERRVVAVAAVFRLLADERWTRDLEQQFAKLFEEGPGEVPWPAITERIPSVSPPFFL